MPTSSVGRINRRPWQPVPLHHCRGSEGPFPAREPFLSRDCEGAVVARSGRYAKESGVTLLELLVVMTIIAVLTAVTYPTASSGLDSLRLRSASDRVMALLNLALDRADRVQQVVEIRVSPQENAISARSMDLSLNRTLELEVPVHIASVGTDPSGGEISSGQRRFLLYPGGTPPRISIELATKEGHHRRITVDPITGMLHSGVVNP